MSNARYWAKVARDVAHLVSLPAAKLSQMLELWFWYYTDPISGKRQRTRYRCSEADARAQYGPAAERVANSLEVRAGGFPEIQPGYMSKPSAGITTHPDSNCPPA